MGDSSGFFLLPPIFAQKCRSRELSHLPDWFIAITPVLLAHENLESREAYPSTERLAILSGTRKADIPGHMEKLQEWKWLTIEKRRKGVGRPGNVYVMAYTPYSQFSGGYRDWIRIDREVVMDGVWSVMSPATRRLYLLLRAHCLWGDRAEGWVISPDDSERAELESMFLPAKYLDSRFLAEYSGIPDRTIRWSRQWLLDNGLMYPTEEDQEDGLILPFGPGRHVPKVLADIKAARRGSGDEEDAHPSGYAKRSMRAIRGRTGGGMGVKTSPKSGNVGT